jgi:phenylacetic acid degradation operon negative regulatory protein
MTTNPRPLILKLMLGADGTEVSARQMIASCRLFGIRENSARVAMLRLATSGMIEASGRGTYRIGPNAAELAEDVRSWRSVESRVRKWHGAWNAVHCGATPRSDRAALRRRDRALQLLGFREASSGLFLRPDNLVGGVEVVRERLRKLGLDDDAAVFVATDFDAERDARVRLLWNGKALTKSYVALRERLEKWLERAPKLEREVAARESFLMGNDAIRQLVFDPLLPDPLVDVGKRRAFVETVLRYDRAGHAIWHAFLKPLQLEEAAGSLSLQ